MISKGSLVELGTHNELIEKNGTYANLVRIQLGGKIDQNDTDQVQEEMEEQVLLLFLLSSSTIVLKHCRNMKIKLK